jgi:DNA-binding MarR family transcriptional regulator
MKGRSDPSMTGSPSQISHAKSYETTYALFKWAGHDHFGGMRKNSDPGTSVGRLLKSGAKMSEILAQIACTNTALRLAARRLAQLYDEAVAATDLKATQVALLAEIARLTEGNGPALQDLAGALAIRISALTHALRPLVRDGLVELRKHPDDTRTKRAVLTRAGKVRLRKAVLLWDTANRRVEAVLGSGVAATLRQLANQVASDKFLADYSSRRDAPGRVDDD